MRLGPSFPLQRTGLSVTRLHRGGDDVVRVLMIADLGRGALRTSSRPRFEEAVVDRLWLRIRRGLEVDVVQDPRAGLHAIAASFASWHRSRYDLVVAVVDPPELLGARARGGLDAILRSVLLELAITTRVVLIALEAEDGPPHHRRSAELGTGLAGRGSARLSVMRIPRGRLGSADAVALHLEAAILGVRPAAGVGPDAGGASPAPSPVLDRRLAHITRLTRAAFGTDVAAVLREVHGRLTTIACAGAEPTVQSQTGSLCDLTLGRGGLVVVGDTWAVPALSAHRAVSAAEPVRFYAGFPIGLPGLPGFGALCVYDRAPHRRADHDFTLLRDLALLVEGELAAARG